MFQGWMVVVIFVFCGLYVFRNVGTSNRLPALTLCLGRISQQFIMAAFRTAISAAVATSRRVLVPKLAARQSQRKIINPSISLFHSTSPNDSSPNVDKVFDKILQLDVVEVHLLTELVNEKMGVKPLTDAQRAAMAGGSVGGVSAESPAAVEEKKTAFDIKLTGFDAKSKIKVIKEIRAITGLGLKDAKEMVEGAPKTIKSDIKIEAAEEIKAKLEAVGATIEIS